MLVYIKEMLVLILGEELFTYSWGNGLIEGFLVAFSILIVILTFKFWKFILFGWWHK